MPGEPEYSVRRVRRDRLILAGLIALFLVGAIGVASGTDWHAILGQIARLSMAEIAILLGLSAINYFLRGLRWHLLVQSLDLHPRFLDNLIHFLGGFAGSRANVAALESDRAELFKEQIGKLLQEP